MCSNAATSWASPSASWLLDPYLPEWLRHAKDTQKEIKLWQGKDCLINPQPIIIHHNYKTVVSTSNLHGSNVGVIILDFQVFLPSKHLVPFLRKRWLWLLIFAMSYFMVLWACMHEHILIVHSKHGTLEMLDLAKNRWNKRVQCLPMCINAEEVL